MLWHCTQTADALMFVPEGLNHAILNRDASFAVSVQVDMQIPGGSLLHFTAFHGHVVGSQLLVETGANVNAKASNGARPLHLATLLGHTGVVQLLLAAGADATAVDSRGVSPLQLAQGMAEQSESRSGSSVLTMLRKAAKDSEGKEDGKNRGQGSQRTKSGDPRDLRRGRTAIRSAHDL